MRPSQTLSFRLTIEQANFVLDLLGAQPYARVHRLIAQMQAQAADQLRRDDLRQDIDAFAYRGAGSAAAPATNHTEGAL